MNSQLINTGHNILVPSLDEISTHIAERVRECRNNMESEDMDIQNLNENCSINMSCSDSEMSSPSSQNKNIFDFLDELQALKRQTLDNIDQKYLNTGVLYLCRINASRGETYKYIVGFTRDLETTLEFIDDTYACEWKIEIITLKESKTQSEEILVKYDLLQKGIDIENNLYDISKEVYDHMLVRSTYSNPFYLVDNVGESYLGKKINNTEHTSEHIE